MKKILLFISIAFLGFIGVWALFGKSSSEFLRDVKIILFIVIFFVYIISLAIIAIGEKDVVKNPLIYAVVISVIAGLSSGLLIFKSWFMVLLVTASYVGVVVYLQVKNETFTNKIYKNKDD